ncbi:MAG: NUDIX domain-containing protein [Candidatus Hodarchaeota archaeon]
MSPDDPGRFMVGIGAIVEHQSSGKILLLKRSSDLDCAAEEWDDVGGRMKQFETPEETLRREIREETGIDDIVVIKPLDVSHWFRGEKLAANETIIITYWCRTSSFEVKLSPEHAAYRWATPEEALTFVRQEVVKSNIQSFIREREKEMKASL